MTKNNTFYNYGLLVECRQLQKFLLYMEEATILFVLDLIFLSLIA